MRMGSISLIAMYIAPTTIQDIFWFSRDSTVDEAEDRGFLTERDPDMTSIILRYRKIIDFSTH